MGSSSTATYNETLGSVLNGGNPNFVGDALAQTRLGTILDPKKFDSGTITASATLTIAALIAADAARQSLAAPTYFNAAITKALVIKTLRVVTSGTGASVGSYIVTDSGGTPTLPSGGASAGVGIATLSDDGTTLTFPNTVTQVVCEFVPQPLNPMSGPFGSGTPTSGDWEEGPGAGG